jgi:hypothetical protein
MRTSSASRVTLWQPRGDFDLFVHCPQPKNNKIVPIQSVKPSIFTRFDDDVDVEQSLHMETDVESHQPSGLSVAKSRLTSLFFTSTLKSRPTSNPMHRPPRTRIKNIDSVRHACGPFGKPSPGSGFARYPSVAFPVTVRSIPKGTASSGSLRSQIWKLCPQPAYAGSNPQSRFVVNHDGRVSFVLSTAPYFCSARSKLRFGFIGIARPPVSPAQEHQCWFELGLGNGGHDNYWWWLGFFCSNSGLSLERPYIVRGSRSSGHTGHFHHWSRCY